MQLDAEAALAQLADRRHRSAAHGRAGKTTPAPRRLALAADQATITQYAADTVRLDVDTGAPGLLILSDAYYPAWQARVDGSPAEVYVADGALRAVAVPAGRHAVEFQYASAALPLGAAITGLTLLALAGVRCCAIRRAESRRSARWLWTATAGLIVVYLAATGLSTFERVRNGAEFLYGEAIVLDEVHRIGLGQPLYPAPTALPLTVTAYPPLYYLLVGWLQQLTGDTGYSLGRLVSVAAVLASAGLLAWSVHRVAGVAGTVACSRPACF